MTNGRQRARWLAELVSDVQRYLSRTREALEADQVRRAVALLQDARREALAESEGGELIERSNLTNQASSIKSEDSNTRDRQEAP